MKTIDKIKVLIADDMPTIRSTLKNNLREIGFVDILAGCDVAESKELLKQNTVDGKCSIDLIVSDWNMPGESGFDFLQYVRGQSPYKGTNLPFILLTTENEKDKILNAINAGVDNYIIKPWTMVDLKTKITQVLVKKEKIAKT